MNRLFFRLVFIAAIVAAAGCTTYRNDAHGTGSTGIRMSGDMDVLGVGVDGAIQAGVHGTGGGYDNRRAINLGGGFAQPRQPCGPTLNALMSGNALMNFLSSGGQSPEVREGGVTGNDSNGFGGYNCYGSRYTRSVTVGGQLIQQRGQGPRY